MFFHAYSKKSNGFKDDYFFSKKSDIDMTISGKFLIARKINLDDLKEFDMYADQQLIEETLQLVQNNYNFRSENIILGNGSNGILQNLIKILFNKKGNLITSKLTFEQAVYAVESYGAAVKFADLNDDFSISLEKLKKLIDRKTRAIYICNPNNPTGIVIETEKILDFIKSVKIPVIVDEAGIMFSDQKSLLEFEMPSNLIVLRSFSKDSGFSGLRVGFAVLSNKYKDLYERGVSINQVSSISLQILNKNLDKKIIKKNIELVKIEREKIYNALKLKGLSPIKSNFNIVMTGITLNDSQIQKLESLNISVVKIKEDKEHYLRFAVQDVETNKKFIEVFDNFNL